MLPPVPPIEGLTQSEASTRRIHVPTHKRMWRRVMLYGAIVATQMITTLNVVILGLAATLWSIGNLRDALATSLVVLVNVCVSTVQAIRARITLERIRAANLTPVTVWRDHHLQTIDPMHAVVGDVVLVRPGDVIVADGVVIVADACDIDESLLTGESDPVRRHNGDLLTSGSTCVAGAAWYQVTAVDGVLARLTQQTLQMRYLRTPLIDEVQRVIRIIVGITLCLIAIVWLRAWWLQVPFVSLVPQLTVLAGLIPNALVLMLTISYALGAMTMSRHGGLVQQLAAVESLSHVDAVCFDKTGTLTANQLSVAELRPLAVTSAEFIDALGRYVVADGAANRTAHTIAAVVSAPPEAELTSVPFDSTRKWSMRVTPSGVWVLGAPDIMRPYMVDAWRIPLAPDATEAGFRVVLLAHAPLDSVDVMTIADNPQLPDNCVPYGVVVLDDALRDDVQSVVAQFASAGVHAYVLSGDDPVAVAHIARRAGIVTSSVIHGHQIDALNDVMLDEVVRRTRVFGRVTPDHKQRIIAALQRTGQRVAMIGDGVNDLLALKQADVAVAMQSGSAAVRQIADVVLLNDQVAVLLHLATQGQQIFQRMNGVLNHFLFRVMLSTLVLIVGLGFGRVLWTPIDSTIIALVGVALPALVLVSWPQLIIPVRLQVRRQLWRDVWWYGGVLLIVSMLVLWLWPVSASVILRNLCILLIWIRLAVGFIARPRVNS